MYWNKNSDYAPKTPEQTNVKMSELALDALTCTTMHLRSIKELHAAMKSLMEDDKNVELQAKVVAWEKASTTTLEMAKRSLEEMATIDPKYGKLVDSRWNDMKELFESTFPMVRVMIDSELADVPPIYNFVRESKKDGSNE